MSSRYLGREIDALELATCRRFRLPNGEQEVERLTDMGDLNENTLAAHGEMFAVLYVHYVQGGVQWVADLFGTRLEGTRQDPALEVAEVCARGFAVPP